MTPSACAVCHGAIDRAPTTLPEGPVCARCYNREFTTVACSACGANTRSLRGALPALCRRCRPAPTYSCIRCDKPVKRHSFAVEGGLACTYCKRFFLPPQTCEKCLQPSRHTNMHVVDGQHVRLCKHCGFPGLRTCSSCRKHRRPAAWTADWRPLCSHCADNTGFSCASCGETAPAQRHAATECKACYARRMLQVVAAEKRTLLGDSWLLEHFDAYVAECLTTPVHNLQLSKQRLARQAHVFVELASLWPRPVDLDPDQVLAQFGVEGLRRRAVAYAWLVSRGAAPEVPLEESSSATEEAAQRRLFERMPDDWKKALLVRYQAYLFKLQEAWRSRGWTGDDERLKDRSVTLLLRAGWRLLSKLPEDVVSPQGIARTHLDTFIALYPGHAHALHSFVGYLNRREKLFQKLAVRRSPKPRVPIQLLMARSRADELLDSWLAHSEDWQLWVALVGLLCLVYARNLQQACRMKRRDLSLGPNGVVYGNFGPVALRLQPRMAEMMRRQLEIAEARLGRPLEDDDYLFPGRLPGHPVSEASMGYHLKKTGVTARQLYTTSLSAFYRGGLRHPKVLVRTLGVTDNTAIRYWQEFSPRVVEELEQRAGRR